MTTVLNGFIGGYPNAVSMHLHTPKVSKFCTFTVIVKYPDQRKVCIIATSIQYKMLKRENVGKIVHTRN